MKIHLLILLAVTIAWSQDSLFLSFDEALKEVIAHNLDIQEVKYEWIEQRENAGGVYGEFEPHLTGKLFNERADRPGSLFTETKDEYKLGVQGRLPTGTQYDVGFNQVTYTHSDNTSEIYFGGELRQHLLKDGPLFSASTNNLRQAKLQRDLAYQKYREALSDVIEKFCDAYWNYYYTQQTLEFSTESANVARQIQEDAHKRFELGLLSNLDYQKAVAEFSDREGARLEALDQLRNARLNLLVMMASPQYVSDTRPLSIKPNVEINNLSDSVAIQDSICLMHPQYLFQKIDLELRESELDFRKTSSLPSVDLVANYGIRSRDRSGRNVVREFRDPERRQSVLAGGVEIDIPLFANVQERHKIAAEKAIVRSSRVKLDIIQKKLSEESTILYQRAQEIREQCKLSDVAVAYHKKELEEEFKKMEMGKSNYHQIFEMEEDLREARQKQLQNMRILRLIDVRLARSTGKILLQNNLESWNRDTLMLHQDLLHE